MRNTIWTVAATAMLLSACQISISAPTPADATPAFVTATLPRTRTPYATQTATSTTTGTPIATAPPNCKEAAVLLQDVSVPDGTHMDYGEKFTKTWQFRNTGTCPWLGYRIAFVSGDRMAAPDTAPIPDTAAKSNVNVSVDLTAPSGDGIYTGFYELRDASGTPLAIGIEKTFWVKIAVGNATIPTPQPPSSAMPTITGTLTTQKPPGSCTYVTSGSYPGEIINLINQARTSGGLNALTVNPQLSASAQAHSIDMACHSLLSHTGSDGSSVQQRIAAAGYGGSYPMEMIYGGSGAYPQDAFNWWMNDPTHHDVIFNTNLVAIGAGFAFVEDSAHGDYYTVDLGGP